MSLPTKKALRAAAFARVSAFDKNNEDETVSIVLPEDLSTLSNDELTALRESAVAAFADLYQDGAASLSADQVAVLRQLKDAKLALDAEKAVRDTAAVASAAEVAALAAEFAADPEVVEEAAVETEVEVAPEAVAEVVAEAEAIVAEVPAVVVASAPTYPRSISVPAIKARQTPVKVDAPRSNLRAAVNVPGLSAGADIDIDALSEAFAHMTMSARSAPIEAAQRANTRFSQTSGIGHLIKAFDPRAVVGEDNDADAAIKFVTDEKNLKGGSLVAAGGWCAPSETVYDLCAPESTDGILSVPEIQIRRGGLRFTQGPDWVDIFAGTGFCFDETDDIGGLYATNELQTLTEGGAGLTSFTLTFGGQTTVAIPASSTAATVQSAIQSLSTVGANNVVVTGPAGASTGPWTVQFVNALGNTDVAQMTSTPTGGSGTLTVATSQAGGGVAGVKPCNIVPCPSFTDVRLNVCGVCIQSGILMNRAYPELVKRYVSGSLVAHAHRVATNVLASMISQATAVSPVSPAPTAGGTGTTSPILSAIELQSEDIKYKRRLPRGTTLEAVFPFWARGAIRADLSRRLGLDSPFDVSDAQIDGWFRMRGINPQFIYNFDNLGGPVNALTWPQTVRFLLYPAGTYVKGASDLITISMLHDSTLNANNNFTAIFTEEAWSVMKLCHESRIVTVPICQTGAANSGTTFAC